MAKKLTDKNTKNEILDEYNRLRAQLEQSTMDNTEQKLSILASRDAFKKVSSFDTETINDSLSKTKTLVINNFEQLANQLSEKTKEFKVIELAIEEATTRLKEINGISDTFKGLDSAKILYQTETDELHKELENFKKMIAANKEQLSADLEQERKNKDRKTEEFMYELKVKKRSLQDEHDRSLVELERILEEKRKEIDYFNELEERIANIQTEIDKAVSDNTAELEHKFESKQRFISLQHESRIKEKELENNNLKFQIDQLTKDNAEIKSLNAKLIQEMNALSKSALENSGKNPYNFTVKSDK